jgi:hypothetical protein
VKRLLIAAALLLASGCVVHGHGRHGHVHGPAVVLETGHVHTDLCGHYYWRGGWHHAHGHRHFAGCGHHFRGGLWIHVD